MNLCGFQFANEASIRIYKKNIIFMNTRIDFDCHKSEREREKEWNEEAHSTLWLLNIRKFKMKWKTTSSTCSLRLNSIIKKNYLTKSSLILSPFFFFLSKMTFWMQFQIFHHFQAKFKAWKMLLKWTFFILLLLYIWRHHWNYNHSQWIFINKICKIL